MKRSRNIRLILIGGLSAGTLAGCTSGDRQKAPISDDAVYTNNYYVAGVGYYHAPFRRWYSQPYNYFDPQTKRYFHGGQWGATPFENITNVSSPTPTEAALAEAQRTDIVRGGFGSTSSSHWIYS